MKTERLLVMAVSVLLSAGLAMTVGCGRQTAEGHALSAEAGHEGHEHDAAAGEEAHADHVPGESAEGEDHHDPVRLSAPELAEYEIELATAGPGDLVRQITLPGEVRLNGDRLAHVVPRLRGVVRRVNKSLGDPVKQGEVLAVIESWELAEAVATHLAAQARLELAEARFARERELHARKISSLEDFLTAQRELTEARIENAMAEQKHQALDLEEDCHEAGGAVTAEYRILAPFGGTVIERHISLGEVLEANAPAFLVADLSTVWVDLNVYRPELPFVRQGQPVAISAGHGIPDATGEIAYLGPVVGESTRTALARVVLDNRGGLWRPGLFVSGRVTLEQVAVPVLIAREAVQELHGEPAVFVETPEGLGVRHLTLGAGDSSTVAVEQGLTPGERYVARGAFTLKAQLAKGSFSHGHVH